MVRSFEDGGFPYMPTLALQFVQATPCTLLECAWVWYKGGGNFHVKSQKGKPQIELVRSTFQAAHERRMGLSMPRTRLLPLVLFGKPTICSYITLQAFHQSSL